MPTDRTQLFRPFRAAPRVLGAARVGLTLCLGAACSSGASRDRAGAPPNQPSGVSTHPTIPIDHDAYRVLGYRLDWQGRAFVSTDLKVLHFEILGDGLAVQDTNGGITLIDPVSGANQWTTRVSGTLTRYVGLAHWGDNLLCASDTDLYILDIRTGSVLDKNRLAVVVNTRPIVARDMVFFGCTSGELLGHNLVSGYKQWGYLLSGAITAPPVISGDIVAVVSQGGDVLFADVRTGESSGRAMISNGLSNRPVAGDGAEVFVAGRDQGVYAWDAATGERLWRQRFERPITDQPSYHAGTLYVSIPGEGLVAFDGATGSIKWKSPNVRGEAIGLRDKRLIVWDGAEACALDPALGDVVDRVRLPGLFRLRMSAFDNGDLYAVRPDGAVARFVPRF